MLFLLLEVTKQTKTNEIDFFSWTTNKQIANADYENRWSLVFSLALVSSKRRHSGISRVKHLQDKLICCNLGRLYGPCL